MPNPRYLTPEGIPQVELLQKLSRVKQVYFDNLLDFCRKHSLSLDELRAIEGVFLIGSHATESEWDNDSSDLDFKLVNPIAIPENLWRYKREVLDKLLCNQDEEKKRWIDVFFAREDYQVLFPRWDLTKYWVADI